MRWTYGKAERGDFARINELFVEMLRSVCHTGQADGYREGDLDRFFAGKEDWICTAAVQEKIIAYLSMEVHREEKGFLYLDDLSVTARYRNMGIGTALLKRAEEYAEAVRVREIRLHAERINAPAIRLYERLGYSVLEEQGSRYLMNKPL